MRRIIQKTLEVNATSFHTGSVCTHGGGVGHQQEPHDEQEAGHVAPGALQRSSEDVHLGVDPEQVPQLDGGQQDQERHQILQHVVGRGRLVETGKSSNGTKCSSFLREMLMLL